MSGGGIVIGDHFGIALIQVAQPDESVTGVAQYFCEVCKKEGAWGFLSGQPCVKL